MRMIILLSILFGLTAPAHAQDIRFSRDQLQQELERYMPYTQRQSIFLLTLEQPTLNLLSGEQRIGVRSLIKFRTALGGEGQGWVTVDGKLRYNSADYSFYLDAPRVLELDIEGVPAEFKPQLKLLVQDVITPFLTERPIYTLTSANMQMALAKMMLKSITIKDNFVVASLGML